MATFSSVQFSVFDSVCPEIRDWKSESWIFEQLNNDSGDRGTRKRPRGAVIGERARWDRYCLGTISGKSEQNKHTIEIDKKE